MAAVVQCDQPEFELVDPVPEDLELGLVGQPPLRGAAQARRGFGPGGRQGDGHQPLRAVRAVDETCRKARRALAMRNARRLDERRNRLGV